MHQTLCKFKKLGQRLRSQLPDNGTGQSAIPRCIHTPNCHPRCIFTPNLEFLPQRISEMCSIIQKFLKLAQRPMSQWLKYGTCTWHSAIPRCIYTLNLEFLPQKYRRYARDSNQFLETRSESVSQGSKDCTRHFFIPRCIHIQSLGFLPQII